MAEIEISTLHEIGYAVGLLLVMLVSAWSGWHQRKVRETTDSINDAVNHRHLKAGPNAPKLYDAVLHLHERTDDISEKVDRLASKLLEVETGCSLKHCDKECEHRKDD